MANSIQLFNRIMTINKNLSQSIGFPFLGFFWHNLLLVDLNELSLVVPTFLKSAYGKHRSTDVLCLSRDTHVGVT